MKTKTSRIFALLMALCLMCSIVAAPAAAATVDQATIDTTKQGSITIYKYDFTNAEKDGVWTQDSYVSTGQYDGNVNTILGEAVRQGDTDSTSDLDANGTSNGYAIKGVEFTYVQIADIVTYSEVEDDVNNTVVLYAIKKDIAPTLLAAIGLTADDRYTAADTTEGTYADYYMFTSDTLDDALQAALEADPIATKNALEAFAATNGTAMALTNANGMTSAENLPLGLYLLVETKVPEMVTTTTNPFFVSVPTTTVNGGGDGSTGNDTVIDNGGHEWLYDVTVYPKNQTGIVTLDKTVRESMEDTGKNTGSTTITDGYDHNATASAGDKVEYQIVSTLPTITSASTAITTYTFVDLLSKGLTYDSETPVQIEFFTTADCSGTPVATWLPDDETPKFTAEQVINDDGTTTMTIAMTEAGLAEINADAATAGNVNSGVTKYAGYSNYTMRVTYAAIVDSDESVVYGDAGNSNEVVLTWSRTSSTYYDTLIDDAHVYTYGINLTKVFSDGKTEQELFDHVKFNVQNITDGYYVVAELNETEGVWYVTGYTENEEDATQFYPVTWNDKPGQLVIKGLEDDTYVLTELETANGYTLLKDNITIVITAEEDDTRPCEVFDKDTLGVIQNDPRYNFDGGLDLQLANIPQDSYELYYVTASATVDGNDVNMIADDVDTTSTNAMVPLKVVNTTGFDLPQTGETGAKWMPIIGGAMIGSAALLLVFFLISQRRREEEELY